jgi:capsular exopolysaccharide synthesis family protein
MSSSEQSFGGLGTGFADQAVNVRRYTDALRRGAWLIAVIVAIVTGIVLIVSLSTHKTYQASASIIYNPVSTVLQPTDANSIERQLATFQTLVQTPSVKVAAARHLSESPVKLKGAISSSVDAKANIITVSATAPRPSLAAARANAVAQAFISQEQSIQNLGLTNALSQLQAQITALKGNPGAGAQIAALQDRISALQINSASTNSELQIAESATPPTGAVSPRPALNAIVALFASLLIGVLVVLGRDQLRPRFNSPREIGRILNLPVLVGIPYRTRLGTARRRRAVLGLEHEAYDALQASIRLLRSARDTPRLLLISSAIHGEGKTTVAANLGRSLARAGQRTLVVSGDMRFPTVHEHFGLALSPGLSECLVGVEEGRGHPRQELERVIKRAPGSRGLDVLTAGRTPSDPSSLMSGGTLELVFDALRDMNYKWILVDSPPMLGLGDTSFLGQHAEEALLVVRLDRVSPEQVEDLHERILRLKLHPLGLVVMGARVEISPYYLSERTLTPAGS